MDNNNKNNIFIGIDLSFNSTGITFFNQLENTIQFHRVAYKDQDKKINQIHNINTTFYRMPTNIITTQVCDVGDSYSFDQYETTLKSMVCIKKIINVVCTYLKKLKDKNYVVHINIEGFIGSTPNFNTITGLIMLQGILRSNLIQHIMVLNFPMQLQITAPTKLKKFFTGNGNAEKLEMIYAFNKYYGGKKLIKTSDNNLEINDVVDSFALMSMSVAKYLGIIGNTKKKIKTKKKTTTKKRTGIMIKKLSISDIL